MADHELVINGAATGKIKDFLGSPPSIDGKPGWEWLPVIDNLPVFDPSTHTVTGPTKTVNINDVTYDYVLTAKTFDDQSVKILRAMAAVLVDEINILRTQHGLSDRTLQQFKNAVEARL